MLTAAGGRSKARADPPTGRTLRRTRLGTVIQTAVGKQFGGYHFERVLVALARGIGRGPQRTPSGSRPTRRSTAKAKNGRGTRIQSEVKRVY